MDGFSVYFFLLVALAIVPALALSCLILLYLLISGSPAAVGVLVADAYLRHREHANSEPFIAIIAGWEERQ